MADRFYVNRPLAPGSVRLEGPEAHHLATVCRLRPGDAVYLFSGDGRQYPALVETVSRQEVTLEVQRVEAPERELGFRLVVATPLPKGDRAHFLIEKLTEVGVTTFVPLRTRHSVVHPHAAKLDKLERHVIEASKQCGRNILLRVGPLTDWQTYCRNDDLPALRYLAHPGGAMHSLTAGQDVALAVGPEGGFSSAEVELALGAGWRSIDLGPRILRVETAALLLAAWATRGT
jgi:16S rRNA (uracil1498-N3)-methyltransferase